MQRLIETGILVQREHLSGRGIEKDDLAVPVNGQNAFLQCIQNVLPLVEPFGQRIRLIAQQGLLDAPGQAQRQQGTQNCGQRTHEDQAQGGSYGHLGHAAQIDPYDHKADDVSIGVQNGGIG